MVYGKVENLVGLLLESDTVRPDKPRTSTFGERRETNVKEPVPKDTGDKMRLREMDEEGVRIIKSCQYENVEKHDCFPRVRARKRANKFKRNVSSMQTWASCPQ